MGEGSGHRRDATCCLGHGTLAARPDAEARAALSGGCGSCGNAAPEPGREARPPRAPPAAGLRPLPRRSLRLRVGGLVLAVEAGRPTTALDPPAAVRPFLATRGGDIRLRYTEEPPPLPGRSEVLFESGGVWRVERTKGGLLYSFRIANRRPPLYKVVSIDEGLREGLLHFDASPRGPHYALDYPLDELLFQHRLAREGAVEVHGCGVVWKGRTLLFCGQSGAGKSTTARLWKRHARGARLLSDDRVVLRPGARGVRAHGTPWHGDGGFASPASAPLRRALLPARTRRRPACGRSPPRRPRRASSRGASRRPWDVEGVERALDACADAAAQAPAFVLAFRPDRSAVEAVRAVVDRSRR